jgi:hypothetical protein
MIDTTVNWSTIPTFRPFEAQQVTSQPPQINPDELVGPSTPTKLDIAYYKPTFRPAVMVAEVSNVDVATFVVDATSEAVPLTTVDEKIDFSDITSTLNKLSTNTIVNVLVVFGLPLVTAMLSFMGAGPLAIATFAWVIPLAAILILPDIRRRR